jgi:multicomponent Na+:H+ antiporter subunit E
MSLLLFWVWLNGSWAADVLIVGAAVAALLGWMFRDGLAVFSELRLTPRALATTLAYLPYYTWELVKANVQLARVVLSPSLPVQPGFVKVRTTLRSRMGRMLLANSITLTPGTLTVELDGEWLYVHWVNVQSPDIEGATASIVAGFERYLGVMYG